MQQLSCLREVLKQIVLICLATIRPYRESDNSEYWRNRAKCPDQKAVLWKNGQYNELYRIRQKEIIRPYVLALPKNANVLDIGCGIGIVSEMITTIRDDVIIDAVDFQEMIEVAQRRLNKIRNINLITSSAEEYLVKKRYDLILSSGCYSAIRNLEKMYRAIENASKMVMPSGIILMIDPFHRWKYLARARVSSKDITKYFGENGFIMVENSGVLFWPYRGILCNSEIVGIKLESKFKQGERLLSRLGKHRFGDYKILVFKKDES